MLLETEVCPFLDDEKPLIGCRVTFVIAETTGKRRILKGNAVAPRRIGLK